MARRPTPRTESVLKQGLEADLAIFLRRIRNAALKFAAVRLRDEEAALDVLQEAMIGFAQAAPRYEDDAWTKLFYRILLRRITDHQRKQGWRERIVRILPFSQMGLPEQGEDTDTAEARLAISRDHTASGYEADELAEAFEAALAQLPARQQESYLLRQWQGLSVKEVAEAMNCSEGSVKTHLSRAMQSLRSELGEWVDE
ncbi:MAG TPA: sigma-70 family RNA polymerase sigma factor [Gammaproteobacteria bacterium]|nr:sigma-70 family RNA polymerase sigma factor [Gammaproteobacteria bacterium]